MSIKSDRWIRRMAAEQRMIEPFEPGQVRAANGHRIVSYGTSSYGYDVRCSDEFKLFTDINTTIVDPKNFDAKSFVDIRGEHCIIPPNSFALARTIEYFRVPRNVLVVCLGKSTYARCFRGDTRVALVDGTFATLEEMARRADSGELFWGYSIGADGRVIVTLLDSPRFVGRDALLEITFDNGEVVLATPDHEFMLRDGLMRQAAMLRPGYSLMPLYRELWRGYEMVYQPLNGHLLPTHRLADEWNVRNGIYVDTPNTHRHHIDFDRRNNRPSNIERMAASAHIRLHNGENYGEDFDARAHGASIREAIERLARHAQWSERFSAAQAERARLFWGDPRYREIRDKLIEARRNPSDAIRERHRDLMLHRYLDPEE
ncbi:MAG TPA: dCTP deaminase, partial [Casimicrobiaceae bacterium]|nr:dCTP deaminase [Casimicrobiaceae bacterium]